MVIDHLALNAINYVARAHVAKPTCLHEHPQRSSHVQPARSRDSTPFPLVDQHQVGYEDFRKSDGRGFPRIERLS